MSPSPSDSPCYWDPCQRSTAPHRTAPDRTAPRRAASLRDDSTRLCLFPPSSTCRQQTTLPCLGWIARSLTRTLPPYRHLPISQSSRHNTPSGTSDACLSVSARETVRRCDGLAPVDSQPRDLHPTDWSSAPYVVVILDPLMRRPASAVLLEERSLAAARHRMAWHRFGDAMGRCAQSYLRTGRRRSLSLAVTLTSRD
ncbi:hypothetical protein JHW43_000127 [Diplocarpon mali]|nr:hypothetical protein JHW43_000127 [Diplocarpon mali]